MNCLKQKQIKEMPRLMDQQILLQTALKYENKVYAAEITSAFTQALRSQGTLRFIDSQSCTIEANLLLERASRLRSTEQESADTLLPLWICDLDEWKTLLIQKWCELMDERRGKYSGNLGIKSIHEYMYQHFQEELSLSMLSKRFHFSRQYIAKKFKELYNSTVMIYLTELRMEQAKSMLLHTHMSVSEVANALGYANENYFCKVFKKQNGLSPLQLRKQQR